MNVILIQVCKNCVSINSETEEHQSNSEENDRMEKERRKREDRHKWKIKASQLLLF